MNILTQLKIKNPITNQEVKFFIRNEKDSSDVKVLREVFQNKYYCKNKYKYQSDQTWLDLGGNIGAFVLLVAPLVKKVISVEAESENFKLLKMNVELNGLKNVELVNKAVVASNVEEKNIYFYVNKQPHNYWKHSMKPLSKDKNKYKKVIVPCQKFSDIISEFDPDCLKMDIEGGELPIMDFDNFEKFKVIIMEYDFLKDRLFSNYYKRIGRLKTTHEVNFSDYLSKEQNKELTHFPDNWFPYATNVFAIKKQNELG